MNQRRYTSSTFVAPGAPVVEPVRTPTTEREPVHVKAALIDLVMVAASWAGVVAAVGLVWDAAARWPLGRWEVIGYAALVVFLLAFALWATRRASLDRRLRARDLRAWEELERDFARSDRGQREALAEVDRLHGELERAQKVIDAYRESTSSYVAPQPTVGEVRAQAVDNQGRADFERVVRELVRRWHLGLEYTRDAMVREGLCSAGQWAQATKAIETAGFAKRAGQGGRWTITARRAEDVIDAVLR